MASEIVLFVIASVGFFLFGAALGYVAKRESNLSKRTFRRGVAIFVGIIWAMSMAAEILIPSYTVSILVHGLMVTIVGYLFSEKGVTLNIGGN